MNEENLKVYIQHLLSLSIHEQCSKIFQIFLGEVKKLINAKSAVLHNLVATGGNAAGNNTVGNICSC